MEDIKLKYFKRDQTNPIDRQAICVVCGKKGIEIGASTKGSSQNKPKLVCIDCAINDYAQYHKIKNISEAKKKRQRMFDVSYLLFENLIDDFIEASRKKCFEKLSQKDLDFNYVLSQEIYNQIPKKEKEKLEKMPQDKIEIVFRQKIKEFFKSQENDYDVILGSQNQIMGQIMTDYIDYHKYLKNDTPCQTEIEQAINTIDQGIATNEAKKMAILILAHAGTKEALSALENFSVTAAPEMKIWAKQAIGECTLFMRKN